MQISPDTMSPPQPSGGPGDMMQPNNGPMGNNPSINVAALSPQDLQALNTPEVTAALSKCCPELVQALGGAGGAGPTGVSPQDPGAAPPGSSLPQPTTRLGQIT